MKAKLETGINIEIPEQFYEYYDSKLDILVYGQNNLYPQNLKTLFRTSPTFNKCVIRESEFLRGKSTSELISKQDFNAICTDYALFNGFSIYVHYDMEGVIDLLQHIPFETIRLKEKGENGIFTRCSYCADWSFRNTINKKKITSKDTVTYFLYSDNKDVRKARANEDGGSEIFYYSEGVCYPISPADSVLAYISSEIGLQNIAYRNVRSNFLPACVLSIPKTSDQEFSQFSNNLKQLQGDQNALKILAFEYSNKEDKPEVVNIQTENYDTSFERTKEDCKNKITGVYRQEAFLRLENGSLGFGSDAISQIYQFYNFSLNSKKDVIKETFAELDESFEYQDLNYEFNKIE